MKTFKNLSILLIVSALCFSLVSCGDDDNDASKSSNSAPIEVDYSTIILGHWANISLSSNLEQLLSFGAKSNNSISLEDLVNDGDSQWGVLASGTFTLTGNVIKANYNDVTVFDSNYNPGTYHGFTDGKLRSVTYTIQSCDGKKLVIKDDGGSISTYEKYADLK